MGSQTVLAKVRAFLSGNLYIYTLAAFSFICSCFSMGFIGVIAVGVSIGICFLIAEDTKPVLAGFAFVVFSFNDASLKNHIMPLVYAGIAPFIFIITAYIIRILRVKKQVGKLQLGQIGLGLIVMPAVCALGGVFTHFDLLGIAASVGLGAVCFGFYLLLVNTMKYDFKEYLAKIVVTMGILTLCQLLWFYITVPDFWYVVDNKQISIGWGNSNDIGSMCVFTLPMALYLSVKKNRTVLFTVIAILLYVGLFFSFSRGNILFCTFALPIMVIYTFVKTQNKNGFLLTVLAALAIVGVTVCIIPDTVRSIFEQMIGKGMSDSGRIALYVKAMQDFFRYPLFGVGFSNGAGGMIMTHDTLLQILQSCGLVGLVASSVYFFQRYKNIFTNFSMFKMYTFFSVMLFELYGLMDMSFSKAYLLFIIYAYAVTGQYEKNPESAFSKNPRVKKCEKTEQNACQISQDVV